MKWTEKKEMKGGLAHGNNLGKVMPKKEMGAKLPQHELKQTSGIMSGLKR